MLKSILLLASASLIIASKINIDTQSRTFRDENNRHIIFHGTNVVVKGAPYLPIQDSFDPQLSLNEKDIQDMIDWGINLVRLGVMWESVEVAPQQYNHTYLDEVDKLINKLGEKGIYTMVDAHQDLFSRRTCGEGMPIFYATDLETSCPWNVPGLLFKAFGQCKALNDYGFRKDDQGLPLVEDCLKTSFIKYYTSPEVCSSFEGLYQNKYGIQDRFVDYWDIVSKKFTSNKYVIGYDPINEPWPANFYNDFSLFYEQTKFDKQYLFPLLQRVNKVIRQNDDKKILFFEPAQFPDTFPFFGGMVANIGFEHTPGGHDYLNRETLNDHTYCCQAAGDMCDSGEPPLEKKDICKAFHVQKVNVRSQDAERLGVPLIFSEFGACANTESCFHEITGAAEEFDHHLASWAYWMFKGFGDFTTTGSLTEGMYDQNGNLQMYKILALQRSYLPAVQGNLSQMFFFTDAAQNGTFTAKYTLDSEIQAPTELFFNEDVYYPKGYKLSVLVNNAPSKSIQIDKSQKNYIKISSNSQDDHQKQVTVVLTKKLEQTDYVVQSNDSKIKVNLKVQDQAEDLSGFTYFKIQNNLDGTTFELKASNGSILCSGKGNYHECFSYNHLTYQVTFSLLTEGWLGEKTIFSTKISNLNSHIVVIDAHAGESVVLEEKLDFIQ